MYLNTAQLCAAYLQYISFRISSPKLHLYLSIDFQFASGLALCCSYLYKIPIFTKKKNRSDLA